MSQSMDHATVGFAKLFDPVAACFTPEVQAHIEELAEKCNEGTLTPEEMAEYDAYVQAMDVVAVLQKKARAFIVPLHAP